MAMKAGEYRIIAPINYGRWEEAQGEQANGKPNMTRHFYSQGDNIELSAHELRPGGHFKREHLQPVGGGAVEDDELPLDAFESLLEGTTQNVVEALGKEELDFAALKHLRRIERAGSEDRSKPRKAVDVKLTQMLAALKREM